MRHRLLLGWMIVGTCSLVTQVVAGDPPAATTLPSTRPAADRASLRKLLAQLASDKRAYHVFEELNTYTAVVYLKKVNHPAAGATAPRA